MNETSTQWLINQLLTNKHIKDFSPYTENLIITLGDKALEMERKMLQNLLWEMAEDWHLWDEKEKGSYPVQRIFDAFKNFINTNYGK